MSHSFSLEGKKGIVLGVANTRSIAWGISKALSDGGAELGLTYQGDRVEKNVRKLAEEVGASLVVPCDVTEDRQVDALFAAAEETFGTLHFLVHSLAFANASDLERDYLGTNREGFTLAHEISSYSLVQLCRKAAPLMRDGGAVVTMTFIGGERVVPKYNVMGVAKASLEASVRYLAYDLGDLGIRVNAISAGPIKTAAAMAIPGFSLMEDHVRERAPLRRNVTMDEIAATARFLVSPASSGITGEIIHVDSGYHVLGL